MLDTDNLVLLEKEVFDSVQGLSIIYNHTDLVISCFKDVSMNSACQ
jgi:hypothetical protein